ncbi:MAG: methyltransferase domain-containing protein [Desulfobacteraceae bacterium]
MDLKETDILGENIGNHWYYRSKAKALKRLLGDAAIQNILDVGAGSGFFSKYLLSVTNAKTALCVDISYDAEFDDTAAGKPIHYRRSIDTSDDMSDVASDDTSDADIVLLMDVLEHVDDDIGLLQGYAEKVSKGTLFLISVPAFGFLWSGHDVYLAHKRRYTLTQVENVVECAGLTVKSSVYYFGAVFPIAAFLRMSENFFNGHKQQHKQQPQSQLKQHCLIVNELLAGLSHMELNLLKYNRLAGLTVFCLAEVK